MGIHILSYLKKQQEQKGDKIGQQWFLRCHIADVIPDRWMRVASERQKTNEVILDLPKFTYKWKFLD